MKGAHSIFNTKESAVMIQLFVYVPESHLEQVKAAMFAAGAGRTAHYEKCAWQTAGTGQFVPLVGSKPYIGNMGEVSQLNEFKLEMICTKAELQDIIKAMRQAHPYEEPAYGALALLDI